jgi:hypothetical protein
MPALHYIAVCVHANTP